MVLDVAAEEMLHWAVVQNLLTAVGSAPFVSRPHFPHQAKGYPARRAAPPAPVRRGGVAALRLPGAPGGRGAGGRRRVRAHRAAAGTHDAPTRSCRVGRSSPRRVTSTVRWNEDSHIWPRCWARTGCSSGPRSTRPRRPPSAGPTSDRSPTWRAPTGPSSASSSRARGRLGTGGPPTTAVSSRVLGEYQAMREADPAFDRPTPSWLPG